MFVYVLSIEVVCDVSYLCWIDLARIIFDFYQSEPSYLPALFADIQDNISLMSMGMWSDMYPSFRTLLFYILLWLLVYLLHYWVVYQQRIFFFY